jgi:hypothetical protein
VRCLISSKELTSLGLVWLPKSRCRSHSHFEGLLLPHFERQACRKVNAPVTSIVLAGSKEDLYLLVVFLGAFEDA